MPLGSAEQQAKGESTQKSAEAERGTKDFKTNVQETFEKAKANVQAVGDKIMHPSDQGRAAADAEKDAKKAQVGAQAGAERTGHQAEETGEKAKGFFQKNNPLA
ncbi:hypothetical protein KFL_000270250 [Klebsormidium nitens]|uniref:Uncharacterized protein n=1 Tax=Klebsormidium nitens TaxID=105231 RepID=A0A1Y1HRR3_KLENI|nr:hypothetical protein KFL_000270250 [Klebsormidium nitens]|eukprot:GAQ79266.1 hypothetical protein KFL_000270250 [Klebsormidium nitens]